MWEKEIWSPSSLYCYPLVFLCVVSLSLGSIQSLTTNCVLDPKGHGGDGVPRQEHSGKVLKEVQVQFWGCHRC